MKTDIEMLPTYKVRRKVGAVCFVLFVVSFTIFKTIYPEINLFILSWMFCLSSCVLGGTNSVAIYYIEKKLTFPENLDDMNSISKILYAVAMPGLFAVGVFLPIVLKVYILPNAN